MDERYLELVERAEQVEARLWELVMDELSPRGKKAFSMHQCVTMARLWASGDLAQRGAAKRLDMAAELREMVERGEAFLAE